MSSKETPAEVYKQEKTGENGKQKVKTGQKTPKSEQWFIDCHGHWKDERLMKGYNKVSPTLAFNKRSTRSSFLSLV